MKAHPQHPRSLRRRRPVHPSAPGRDRVLFNAVGLGVVYQDASGLIVAANPAAERILGQDGEPIVGRSSFDPRWKAVWSDGRPAPGDEHPSIVALRTKKQVGPVELGVVGADGGVRWLLVTAIPTRSTKSPGLARVCVIFEDITVRKTAEDAIRVSEERVQRLVEANVIGIIVAERQGVIQANDEFLAMVGCDREDLASGLIDWRAMTPDEFLPMVDTAVRDIAEVGVSAAFEKEFIRKDGSRVPVLIGAARLDSTPLRWVSFVVDLSSLKLAQGEIQRQANLLDQAYDAIFAWDWNGGITYWNRGAERLYGYTAEEAAGRRSHELLNVEYQTSVAEFRERLEREGMLEDELIHIHRDGRRLMVETRHVFVNDPGRPYVLEVNRDITSRHEFERERQTFVDTLAHDLRNPLGAAKAQAQLLMRRIERDTAIDQESVRRGLESVVGSVNRMNGLIGEMLDAGHLREGQPLELQIARVDLVALAAGITAGFDKLTPRHSLSLETSLRSLEGMWDRSRLERVLGNLLDNAVKYSPAGGTVVVSISSESTIDQVWALLSVSDQGLGIPADQVSHVFERFQRGRNVTGRITGAGIGLSGVKQIVEQHGGAITVESMEGKGSTFTIRLPVGQ